MSVETGVICLDEVLELSCVVLLEQVTDLFKSLESAVWARTDNGVNNIGHMLEKCLLAS